MGYIAETAVKVTADTKGFHSQVESGVMGSVKKIATGAAAALGGLAIGKALFVDPIKSAGEFQQSLNVLQATSHATDARMKEISATAMKLGADAKLPAVSASDAANAMLELAKGGFSAKQSMEGARGVLLLSTAAQIDGATAATMVADAIHAFGLRAKDAGTVVNDFAGAANASTASMSEVGQSLQQSGQAFHQLGIPVGDAATAIAAMANAGIKGSDAGTSLKTMLQRLNPQTKQAKQAFKDMNIDVFDQHGKFIGLRQTIEQFSPKLRAMTQEQRQHALQVIFGSDAQRAASIILGQTTGAWDKQHAAVTKAGQAQALADAQTKGFKGAMAQLRSTIENVQLQIGLKLLPVLTEFARWLSSVIPTAVATVSAALSDLSGIVQTIGTFLTENVGSWRQIGIALGIGAAAFVTLTAAVKTYTIAQAALNVVMEANPIGLVIIAIAALVVSLTLLYQRSAQARAIMDAAFAGMKAAATATIGFITTTLIPAAIAAWNRFGPGVVSALQTAAATIKTVVQAIATVVNTVVDQIRQHWEGVWKIFGPFVTTQLNAVKTIVTTTLNVIAGVVRLFAALLRGDWSGAWNALKGIVSDVLNGVVSLVTGVLKGMAQTAFNLAKAIGSQIGNGIKAGLSSIAGLAGDLVGKIGAAISQAAGQAYTLARAIGFKIADGAISGIGNLAGRLGSAIAGAVSSAIHIGGIIHHGSGPWQSSIHLIGAPIADGIVQGFEERANANRPKLLAAISKMSDSLVGATKAQLPKIQDAYKAWATGAQAAFDAQVGNVTKTIDAQFTKAQARLDAWKAKLTPGEMLLAAQQASAAVAKVQADVSAAAAALNTLPAKQAAAWSALLAQQKANMDALRATLQSTTDDALLAGNTFNRSMAKNASDPLAQQLIYAQQVFDAAKKNFDAGLVSQAEFIAAANQLDDTRVAAADDANALQLLDQYNAWQQALAQQAAAGSAITAQEAADQEAQRTQAAQNQADLTTAREAYEQAIAARDTFWLEQRAQKERAAKDAQYQTLSDHLKAMHDRTLTHLQNVQHAWDLHYAELARMASQSGDNIGDNLANALRRSIPTVAAAAAAVAQAIANSLKVHSPTKEGPMSDLDHWWDNLAPTLLQGFDGSRIQAALHEAVMPPSAAYGNSGSSQIRSSSTGERWSSARMEMLLERIEKHTQKTATKPVEVTEVHVAGSVGMDASVYRARR